MNSKIYCVFDLFDSPSQRLTLMLSQKIKACTESFQVHQVSRSTQEMLRLHGHDTSEGCVCFFLNALRSVVFIYVCSMSSCGWCLFHYEGSNVSVLYLRCLWTPAPPSTLEWCWSGPPASPPVDLLCCQGCLSMSCLKTPAGSFPGAGTSPTERATTDQRLGQWPSEKEVSGTEISKMRKISQ